MRDISCADYRRKKCLSYSLYCDEDARGLDARVQIIAPPAFSPASVPAPVPPPPPISAGEAWVPVPLIALAWGRSGDKGDNANMVLLRAMRTLYPLSGPRLTANLYPVFTPILCK